MKREIDFKNGLLVSCNRSFKLSDLSTWPSLIIRSGTRSNWSHTALMIKLYGMVFVIDSDFGRGRNGVGITPWNEWIKTKKDIHIFDPNIPGQNGSDLVRRMLSVTGIANYDLKGLAAEAHKVLKGRFPESHNGDGADKAFYCSEYAGWALYVQEYWKYSPERLFSKRHQIWKNGQDVFLGRGDEVEWVRV